MDLDQFASHVVSFLLIVLFARGVRATWEINQIYQSDVEHPKSLIFRQILVGSTVKVAAAGWFAFWNLRGLLMGQSLDEPFLSIVRFGSVGLAAMVLDLPSRYLKMTRQIMDRDLLDAQRGAAQDAREVQQDIRELQQDAREETL